MRCCCAAYERARMGFGVQKLRTGQSLAVKCVCAPCVLKLLDERTGGDSCSGFDECRICISQAVDPVACGGGDLFCKGCIYEYLLKQKQDQKAQLAAWKSRKRWRRWKEGNCSRHKRDWKILPEKKNLFLQRGPKRLSNPNSRYLHLAPLKSDCSITLMF